MSTQDVFLLKRVEKHGSRVDWLYFDSELANMKLRELFEDSPYHYILEKEKIKDGRIKF